MAHAWMDSVALRTRQGHVCVAQAPVLCPLDPTDYNTVNYVSSEELSAGGYCRIMQLPLKHAAREHYLQVPIYI